MKVTKLEHACIVVEIDGSRLVIDPGSFTIPLVDTSKIVAVVVTHEHADHWTPDHLKKITADSPDAILYAAPSAAAAIAEAGFEVTPTHDGDVVEVDPFTLRFVGETHAVIHSSIPLVDNVGVLVNDTLFYPGDAFTVPPFAVDTLAAPAAAPWMKLAEGMDYVLEVAPRRAFPVHQMVLSVIGQGMTNGRLQWATEQGGGEFRALEPGESMDI